MFPPGLEPGTFRVLGERDNHYTTETPATITITAMEVCWGSEGGLWVHETKSK